ncbi:MAG: hypothetical protein AAFV77_04770, partial [Planctomycetota bacterium]
NTEALPDSLAFRRGQLTAAQERLLQLSREEAALNDRRAGMVALFEATGRVSETDAAGRARPQSAAEVRLRELEARLVASGAVGTRFSTELTRVYNGIDLPALDLYRMRHVIEPNATVWYGDGTVAQGAIPVYDENVEDFARGPAVRFGVDQTFQTMRGSLGGYESVDVLRVGAHFVFAGEDRPDADRTPRFFDAYPERSQLGDFFDLDVAWRLTDAVGVTGQFIYDLESNRTAEGVVGVEISQLPDMRFFAELRRLGYSEDTYINAGADYELGDRYSLGALGVYNERAGEFQSGTIRVNREMPHLILTARLTYNDITGDTTVGFSFQPTGINRGRDRVSRLGASLLGN